MGRVRRKGSEGMYDQQMALSLCELSDRPIRTKRSVGGKSLEHPILAVRYQLVANVRNPFWQPNLFVNISAKVPFITCK